MPTTLALRTSFPASSVPAARSVAPAPDLLATLNGALLRGIETLELWAERLSQRRILRTLPDHLLQDIGRSRADAEAEADKPFWRP